MKVLKIFVLLLGISFGTTARQDVFRSLDFMVSPKIQSPHKETLEKVIAEEIQKRTGFEINSQKNWKTKKSILAVALLSDEKIYGKELPVLSDVDKAKIKPEGFRLFVEGETIWVIGADVRGTLFGIGKLLRVAEMTDGQIAVPENLDIITSPEYPLRGHQLGYRNTANSWDKWTPEQYDQYIRELALFGANSIEDIPFEKEEQSVHMIMPHKEMHPKISQICANYDLEYWVWTPATGNLSDESIRENELKLHEEFYKSIPRLDGIFFPGGDPGDNHPKYVMPHLKELAALLHKYHPNAGVWISLQGFERDKVEYFFNYLKEHDPDWLEGVVYGPSSPPIDLERRMLPAKYKHRLYGDLTHTVRCQYPTEDWDQAFALTLGREAPNPQPYYYARIFKEEAIFTDGFLSYSDGVHDDVNKVIWNQMGCDSNMDVRDVLTEYGRFFFEAPVAEAVADGILALEKNWVGPIVANGGIEATLLYWQDLEAKYPRLRDNWRWQLLLVRAYYDAYIRHRAIFEKTLEKDVNVVLGEAKTKSPEVVMQEATAILKKADTNPVSEDLKDKIIELAERLFNSTGLQSSVPKYQGRSAQRGCFIDFLDIPLNNRWWLEDEFEKTKKMGSEKEKLDRLELIANWENPGKGGYYDNVSDVSASPNVVSRTDDAIDYAWWDNGRSRKRLSTQLFQFLPVLEYNKLDPEASYLIRVSGYSEALLRANDVRLTPTKYEKELETFKEFLLPKELIKEGKLRLTFDQPDELELNWRQYSKVMEVWLIRQ
ncbi:hypothetical protein [Reichenbachiella sp. MALMAid0571]|uniref:hypothetical protein n=1 Tax=Reichenbachiella sp. MALMAid0571 TaxID=3143939 RepID=UPI0032DEF791